MKYKILIFDLDDTIIDNRENVRTAFKKMIESNGCIYSDIEFERWYYIDKKFWIDWQNGLIEIPEKLNLETGKKSDEYLDWVRSQRVLIYFNDSISHERAIELNTFFMNALNETIIAIDGVHDTLKYLAGKYNILVATNGPKVATRQKLKKIDCQQYITEILSADMFGYMKPKIEFFEAIEKRYKDLNRSDYLIVGDSLKSDVEFGMNTGIDSCWFNKNNKELDDEYKPTIIINKLSDLIEIL
jgi:HAD superfamily hydrolase (TIGR01549 family)